MSIRIEITAVAHTKQYSLQSIEIPLGHRTPEEIDMLNRIQRKLKQIIIEEKGIQEERIEKNADTPDDDPDQMQSGGQGWLIMPPDGVKN